MKQKSYQKPYLAKSAKNLRLLIEAEKSQSSFADNSVNAEPVTRALYAIWKDLLAHENFGIEDDFFKVGGNSIKVVQMVSRIAGLLNVEVPVTDIFFKPTIASLSLHIQGLNKSGDIQPAIKKYPDSDAMPLSFSQERIWFIDQLEGSTQYHLPIIVKLEGNLNENALVNALKTIMLRHEVLRSVVYENNHQSFQKIMDAGAWEMNQIDGAAFINNEDGLNAFINQITRQPFDLSKDFMLRATLIKISDNYQVLAIAMHHIASDGWSFPLLAREVNELYNAFLTGREHNLAPLPIQYPDYAIWQRNHLSGLLLDDKLNYWKAKLASIAPLELPTDFPRPAVQSIKGTIRKFSIDAGLTTSIQQLGLKEGTTLFMTLLAVFKILLYRYTGQEEICVGTPIANRPLREIESLIGFFVTTLALKTNVNEADTISSLLKKIKQTTVEAYEHQDVPLEKVVEAVVKERDMSNSPLFQVMFVLQNTDDIAKMEMPGLNVSAELWENGTSKFDFSFYLTQTSNGIEGFVEYCTDLYEEQTIDRLISHYIQLLQAVVTSQETVVAKLPLLSVNEKSQLLHGFNNTAIDIGQKTFLDLFEQQVQSTPENIAVQFENTQLTYTELNTRANQLAHYLVEKGIGKEMLLPLCIDRSGLMIVGILGILKTGAAFVPVDPEYPADRINFMIADSQASIILASTESRLKLKQFGHLEIILLDQHWPEIKKKDAGNLAVKPSPDSLIYVIHTSGSTGKPKGVMIEHQSVVNLLHSITQLVNFSAASAFLSVTTFSFDISYLEFFVPLINGGKLIIVPKETSIDGFELAKVISTAGATHLQATPVTWQLLLDAGWKNKEQIKMLIGGEAVKEDIKNAFSLLGELYNLYGPTETTIWSVAKQLSLHQKVLIGKPIANTGVYILSNQYQLQPIGVTGEIYIGGKGLAKGYLNRPDLTDEKFIANPVTDCQHDRIYRTGDLGRWTKDGNIECLGRIDQQVKIRGYRIELEEIEAAMTESSLVTQAVVLARPDNAGNNKLVGYYIPKWSVVREKEKVMHLQQINNWQAIYETEYAESEEVVDPEFDTGIWHDSFTGAPMAVDQIKEFITDIVSDILSEEAGHVLEIGCGKGLVYYQLAGKVKKYTGLDFSANSIQSIKDRIEKAARNYGDTELIICAAHELSMPPGKQVDTIVMNSIVQYFPGEEYMNGVMDKCMSIISDNGRIIIGDVRDNRLLDIFKLRLQLLRTAPGLPIRDLLWSVEQDVLNEEELCLQPGYFTALQSKYKRISHVEIKWKNIDTINELTLYRYTVIIHVGVAKEIIDPAWHNWNETATQEYLSQQLSAGENTIAIKNVPSTRLFKDRVLKKLLQDQTAVTVAELLKAAAAGEEEPNLVQSLFAMAKVHGYSFRLLLNNDPFKTDIVFQLPTEKSILYKSAANTNAAANNTNTPLFTEIAGILQAELKALLENKLPKYMVPSELVALRQLPLTNNGKVDRVFLSSRASKGTSSKLNYTAPQTPTQVLLVAIWQELFGIAQVGIHDNFFELGGHSLMAMRLVSAMRQDLHREISIKALFNNPTVAALSFYLEEGSAITALPPVEKQERPDFIPLSFSQERLWFIDKLEGSVQYHLTAVLRLFGKFDYEAFNDAFKLLLNRHEPLRTNILEEQGKSYQRVMDAGQFNLNYIADETFGDAENLRAYILQLTRTPFNLSRDYMLRSHLLKISGEEHVLVTSVHHIASDGWSVSIFVRELLAFYAAIIEHRKPRLLPLSIQYADYAIWQRKHLQGKILETMLDFWKAKLDGVPNLQLPLDFPRPARQGKNGALIKFHIGKELSTNLQALSVQQGSTLFMTLIAAFNVLLKRYSSQTDICIGTPVANRGQQELEDLIGFFVNTLAIRTDLEDDLSFVNLLQRVKNNILEAYANQQVPFEKIVEVAGIERDLSRNPIFQVLFSMQNNPAPPAIKISGLEIVMEEHDPKTAQLDIICNITETNNGLEGLVEYCTDLFAGETIERMMVHFTQLLASVVASPGVPLSTLGMLDASEQERLILEIEGERKLPEKNTSIIHLFEEQVKKSPAATALVFNDIEISYEQLNSRANQLAHALMEKGVGEDILVGICVNRSVEMIVGIMGILKAGAAFVPIDPELPVERITYILEDTSTPILLHSSNTENSIPSGGYQLINLDKHWQEISKQPVSNPGFDFPANSLAYVIYTSGSTGRPKGVMVENAAILNYLINNKTNYISADAGNSGSFMHLSYTFDASLTAIFMPLLHGKVLVISSGQALQVFEDPNLHKYAPYDFIKLTPAHLSLLHQHMNGSQPVQLTQLLVVGGEALFSSQLKVFAEDGIDVDVINEYGPTEAAVGCSIFRLNIPEDYSKLPAAVSIGKAITNAKIYILGNQNELLPVGAIGEIAISGQGIARGYLNQPSLTDGKFIRNPFHQTSTEKLYKTGDMARRHPDGNIEYIGRKDDQVKIRGYRVELGEIESILNQSPLVKQCVILARESKEGGKRLVAYVVPEYTFNKEELQSWCRGILPGYMVPVQWVSLQSLPLTTNGKINRRSLPEPDISGLPVAINEEQTANEFEQTMITIWQDLLEVNTVGLQDNFFDLGGDSIISIQMVSRARKQGYELKIGDLFSHQTISLLNELMESRSVPSEDNLAENVLKEGPSGLLPIQHWFFKKQPANPSHFNQSILVTVDKNMVTAALEDAVEKLIFQHDALRFSYHFEKENWQQILSNNVAKNVVVVEDMRHVAAGDLAGRIEAACSAHQEQLDIEKGVLLRAVHIQTPAAEGTNRLLIIIHHLVVDGVSWRIILEDLTQLLNGWDYGSTKKTASVNTWFEGLKNYGLHKAIHQKKYWKKILDNYTPLPVDMEYEGSVKASDTATHTNGLNEFQTKNLLQSNSGTHRVDVNDIFMGALAKTFTGFNKSGKVVIAMEGHGREQVVGELDTSHTVGWFTSLYPVLLQVDTEDAGINHLKNIKEQLRAVPDKGIGFGVLKYLNEDADLQQNPAWDLVFNYLGQTGNLFNKKPGLFNIAPEKQVNRISPEYPVEEKISINGTVLNGQLLFEWTYSKKHYAKQTIERLADEFTGRIQWLLDSLQANITQPNILQSPSDYGLGNEISYQELDTFLDSPLNEGSLRNSFQSIYPLSNLQKGILFHGLYDGAGTGYINHFWCDLVNIDAGLLQHCWNYIMQSHTALRSSFHHNVFSIPVQVVHKDLPLPVKIIDLRGTTEEQQAQVLKEVETADKRMGFDFEKGPMMRVILFQLDDRKYRMLWSSHHIIFDGWSRGVMMAELLRVYNYQVDGKLIPPTHNDQYEDYIRYLKLLDKDAEKAFWRHYMKPVEEGTLLPFIKATDERNKGLGTYRSVQLSFKGKEYSRIEKFTQTHRITHNTLMQGIWAYLLHHYTGKDAITYGVIVSGRPEEMPRVEQRVGMFINAIPLVSTYIAEQEIAGWLQEMQAVQLSSRQFQFTALHDIKHWSGIAGDLFDSMVVFENYPLDLTLLESTDGLIIENIQTNEQTNYPLSIIINNHQSLEIEFSYNTGFLEEAEVTLIRNHFEHLLLQIVNAEKQMMLSQLTLVTPPEKYQLLQDFKGVDTEYPNGKTLVALFEAQVLKTPYAMAVVFDDQQLTYHDLNERANQLAKFLLHKGIGEESLVPISLDRSPEMIIGIWAILKAGAAYVPIDPDYPAERIAYTLEDTKATLLLTNAICVDQLPDLTGVEKICIDSQWLEIGEQAPENLNIKILPNRLAYVIYTSGSTGKPKGVMNEHGGIVNRLNWAQDYFQLTPADTVLQKTTFCFDVSVWELLWPSLVGSKIVFAKPGGHKDQVYLKDLIESQHITVIHFVPSMLSVFVADISLGACKNLKKVLCSGEALTVGQVELFAKKFSVTELHNLYGPTEAAIDVTCWSYQRGQPLTLVPIGKPVANTSIYILNQWGQLLPVGCMGEITIGGTNVARGYLNLTGLTATKFVKDPFIPQKKMYRTGDWGRWDKDGNIEYLGRMDQQVKIRGYRIEPGEIETTLLLSKLVKQVAVLARKDKKQQNQLICYVVTAPGYSKEKAVNYLEAKLPDYMIPAVWTELENLPLTDSGKLNRRLLPAAESNELLTKYVAPSTELEEKLVNIWKEILSLDQVGIHDNFFELGGHSLSLMQLVAALKRELGFDLPVRLLFHLLTIAELANHIRLNEFNNNARPAEYETIKI